MSDIFLSYATEDRPKLRPFVAALEARDWSVWWDRTIPPGQAFDRVIEKALDGARCVVVLWSSSSVQSDWVKTEAAEAAKRGILVPVLIDDVMIPLEFRRIQAARLVGWTGTETHEFRELMKAVGTILGDAGVESRRGPGPDGEPKAADLPERAPSGPTRYRWLSWAIGGAITIALVVAVLVAVSRRPSTVIGVMEIKPGKGVDVGLCDFTRDGLNTVMNRLKKVQVFSKQKIDFVREKRGLSEFEAAEQLGIGTMLSGSLVMKGQSLVLEVEAVDVGTGMLVHSETVRGDEARLVDMQNETALAVLSALQVEVSPDEVERMKVSRANDQIDTYRLLTQTMGGYVDEEPAASPQENREPHSWLPAVVSVANADDKSDVLDLLERYRRALEQKDMKGVDAAYVTISDGMRGALERFFTDASDVKILFSDFDIEVNGDAALATFTRVDDFMDARTGQRVRFEIRVSSLLAKQSDGWRIRGLKKPS
ncbi:MAG TPA: TIR domain-containing protein [Candidatus Binatia bacterium]|jgi:TolB-like protein|nr:TIR domain-containing protein [Candidatus Binatia bacterium]